MLQLSRQVLLSHRGDAHRVGFLRRAVIGYSWSHEPLSRVATHGLTFQQLFGELESALQLDKEAQIAMLRDKASKSYRNVNDEVELVNYAGQGRYKFNQIGNSFKNAKEFDPLSVAGCLNCGNPAHVLKDCPKPLNVAQAAARRLEYFNKKKKSTNAVHFILANLCRQLEDTHIKAEKEDSDDVEIFKGVAHALQEEAFKVDDDRNSSDQAGTSEYDIFVVDATILKKTVHRFEGACVDSGAQKTVIRLPQAKLYSKASSEPFNIKKSGRLYKFGNGLHDRLGIITIRFLCRFHILQRLKRK